MIYCFHGSPGTPEDFKLMSDKMVGLKALKRDEEAEDGAWYMGYSWGCVYAIKAAGKAVKPKGLILISPFIEASKSQIPKGSFKRRLIGAPVVGEVLLGMMANRAIDSFLTKSSHPLQPPAEYVAFGSKIKSGKILKQSILEKEVSPLGLDPSLLEMISGLNYKSVPILLIHGDSDSTSDSMTQWEPIRRRSMKTLVERTIPNAGHALVWTHPTEVSKIIKEYL